MRRLHARSGETHRALFNDPAGAWLLGAAFLQIWFSQVMLFAVAASSELFYAARRLYCWRPSRR